MIITYKLYIVVFIKENQLINLVSIFLMHIYPWFRIPINSKMFLHTLCVYILYILPWKMVYNNNCCWNVLLLIVEISCTFLVLWFFLISHVNEMFLFFFFQACLHITRIHTAIGLAVLNVITILNSDWLELYPLNFPLGGASRLEILNFIRILENFSLSLAD